MLDQYSWMADHYSWMADHSAIIIPLVFAVIILCCLAEHYEKHMND